MNLLLVKIDKVLDAWEELNEFDNKINKKEYFTTFYKKLLEYRNEISETKSGNEIKNEIQIISKAGVPLRIEPESESESEPENENENPEIKTENLKYVSKKRNKSKLDKIEKKQIKEGKNKRSEIIPIKNNDDSLLDVIPVKQIGRQFSPFEIELYKSINRENDTLLFKLEDFTLENHVDYNHYKINHPLESLIISIKNYQVCIKKAKQVTLISYTQIGKFLMFLKHDLTQEGGRLNVDEYLNYLNGNGIHYDLSYINKIIKFSLLVDKWEDLVYSNLSFHKITKHFKEIEEAISYLN